MKKTTLFVSLVIALFSCSKKKEKRIEQGDKLFIVKDQKVNELIRNYDRYEKAFIDAIKKGDVEEIKKYSDSANYYDKELFDENTIKNLSSDERIKFSERINTIRKEKINKLSNINSNKTK